ncbi:MAG: 30S ribosomal protein S16, partial [Sphaerochaetaceae bacterium]|nr:30S ribosomal protein S16 [Sphaerochaetaceae bacterium]
SRSIEEVGHYHPVEKDESKQVVLKEDRIKEWLSKGAQPSTTVKRILNKHNIFVDRTVQE